MLKLKLNETLRQLDEVRDRAAQDLQQANAKCQTLEADLNETKSQLEEHCRERFIEVSCQDYIDNVEEEAREHEQLQVEKARDDARVSLHAQQQLCNQLQTNLDVRATQLDDILGLCSKKDINASSKFHSSHSPRVAGSDAVRRLWK